MLKAHDTSRKYINLENTVLLTKARQDSATSNLWVQFIWLSFGRCPLFLHFLEALDMCF